MVNGSYASINHIRLTAAALTETKSLPLKAGCTNAQLTIWLANRRLTLTAQLTRCRVARSTVN